jgi:hypothetical protein
MRSPGRATALPGEQETGSSQTGLRRAMRKHPQKSAERALLTEYFIGLPG